MRTTRRWSVIAFLAIAAIMATMFGAASATATPNTGYSNTTLAASPASGAVGSTTTVTGDLFTPGATVSLTFNSTDPTPVGTATVSSNGTFSAQVTVPQGKEVGDHSIRATSSNSNDQAASTAFRVTAGNGTGGVTVTDPTPAPGQSITVTGKSCTPGTTVTVSLDGTTVLGTGTAGSDGAYSIGVTIPSGTSTGSHQIQVSGAGAGCSGVLGVTVTAGGSNGGGGLASTGVAVIGIGALGVVLLVGGGLMLLAGRRRRTGTLV